MKYNECCGKKISQMSLGTVQLGMNYGIANNSGQPDEEKSFEMLRTALNGGISSLDTARAYGTSEEVLGRFFKTYDGSMPFITTKVSFKNVTENEDTVSHIINSAESSLERLGLKKVNCIMLHDAEILFSKGEQVNEGFSQLLKKGYTDIVGVSVYNGEQILKMLENDMFTATQIPMSIFDQRLINSGITERLHEKKITTFVRSVFLQGLFFLDPEEITDPILIQHAKDRIIKLNRYAEREGMSVAELAIAFIRDIPGVTSLVLGADTSYQVESNIRYFDTKPISEETLHEIREAFIDVDIPEIMKVLARPKNK